MELYLIRHTAVDNPNNLCYGRMEMPLRADADASIQKIAEKLPKSFEIIYASPTDRCTLLAKKLQGILQLDERLSELNFGTWEGIAWNDLPKAELNAWMQDFVSKAPPHGESLKEMFSRVLAWFQELRKNKTSLPVAVCTSAGTIRCILAIILNLPLENIFKIKVDYGCIVQLHVEENAENDVLIKISNG
jgi:alpha-ribazole phosphatase